MSPDEFQRQLEIVSTYNGVPFGRVQLLFQEEEKHEVAMLQFHGHMALSDAFKCVFLEATELLNTVSRPKIKRPLTEFYGLYSARVAHNFQSLCGAERVAIRGYPLLAYTSLRNVFDNLLLSSAAMQRLTDFYAIEGLERDEPFDRVKAAKLRKTTEFSVRRHMTGQQSGLSADVIDELKKWDALFDIETHGARLSLSGALGWLKGTEPLPVLPRFNEQHLAVFMNRYSEVAWMAHRLLPLLQPPDVPLPGEWREKWRVVDASFQIMVGSLTEQLGKKIGSAILEFVDAKFPFDADSTFPL